MQHYSSALGAWVTDWRHPVTGKVHHLVAVKSGKTYWAYFDDQFVGSEYETLEAANNASASYARRSVRRQNVKAASFLAVVTLVVVWATSLSDATTNSHLAAAVSEMVASSAPAAESAVLPALPIAPAPVAAAASVIAESEKQQAILLPARQDRLIVQVDARAPPPPAQRPLESDPAQLTRIQAKKVQSPERRPQDTSAMSEYGQPYRGPVGAVSSSGDASERHTSRGRASRQSAAKKLLAARQGRHARRMVGRGHSSRARPDQRRRAGRGGRTQSVLVRCYIGGRSERCWRRFRAPTRSSTRWVRCFVRGKSEWCRVGG
ncbi:MAG: hypothetical protein RLZ98_653 [Pseudomonadota bacterium]|jgi:hypothetical protein